MTLSDSMAIAGMGLDTQVERMQIHTANIANLGTPGYQRQVPILVQNTAVSFGDLINKMSMEGVATAMARTNPDGVQLAGTVTDQTPGKKIYMPEHPLADAQGYVTMSNSNPLGDMADATLASKMYEANLSVYNLTKTMATRAIELGRGQ